MFWPDIIDLRMFYAKRTGGMVTRIVRQKLRQIWPDMPGETLLGIGYTSPYLDAYLEDAGRVLSLMPSGQGALRWPVGRNGNLSLLADEAEIPLPEESISRVLVVHAMENTEQLRHMLREIWRVLAPGGRLLIVVPNRRGMWARSPGSPFAQGSPFTGAQMRGVLREHQFTPYESHYILFTPPMRGESLLRFNRFFEAIGPRLCRPLGGLLVMEAEKQIYAPSTQKTRKQKRARAYALPASQPAASRV